MLPDRVHLPVPMLPQPDETTCGSTDLYRTMPADDPAFFGSRRGYWLIIHCAVEAVLQAIVARYRHPSVGRCASLAVEAS